MTQPLFGKHIVVTRARAQAEEFIALLCARGAIPIEAPTIRIAEPKDTSALDYAFSELGSFDWIVFTSSNGVDAFMLRLQAKCLDLQAIRDIRLCAVGPATAAQLTSPKLEVALIPKEHHSSGIVDALRKHSTGSRILLPRADLAKSDLPDALRNAGAEVCDVVAYRTIPVSSLSTDVTRAFLENRVDVVTFTSASTVTNFVKLVNATHPAEFLGTTIVASIGPVTAKAAEQLGVKTTIIPSIHTVPALVQAMENYFR